MIDPAEQNPQGLAQKLAESTAALQKERESGKQLFAALRGWGKLAEEKGLRAGEQIPLSLIQAGKTQYNDFLSEPTKASFAPESVPILGGGTRNYSYDWPRSCTSIIRPHRSRA